MTQTLKKMMLPNYQLTVTITTRRLTVNLLVRLSVCVMSNKQSLIDCYLNVNTDTD